MKIDVAYGRDLDDGMLTQLQYMEADAYACYESMDSDESAVVVGTIPTETLKQFKRRTANTLFLMKVMRAKSNAKLVGMACLSKKKKDVKLLHTVYVKPAFRSLGIGEAIIRKALYEAKKMKCSVSLSVNPLNSKAKCLYEKVGFKVCKGQMIEMHAASR